MTISNKKIILILAVVFFSGVSFFFHSCVHAPYVLPENLRTGDPNICFERDVLPIFQSNCAKSRCHDEQSGASGYTLNNYQNIVSKGIVPGNPDASKLWECVSMHVYNISFMPQDAPALSPAELYLIRRWIATGAIDSGACNTDNCDTTAFTYSGTIAPIMQTYCVGCHNSSSSAGGSLNDYTSVANAAVNGRLLGDVEQLSGYNAMPKGGSMLSNCKITQLKKWVAAGAPNN